MIKLYPMGFQKNQIKNFLSCSKRIVIDKKNKLTWQDKEVIPLLWRKKQLIDYATCAG